MSEKELENKLESVNSKLENKLEFQILNWKTS